MMKEVPFIQHNPPIPLPGCDNGVDNEEGTVIKRFIVSADQQQTTNQNNIDGSINITLSESTTNTNTSSTALVPLENTTNNNTTSTINFEDENYNLRALSSTYYNTIDDTIIITNGIPDKGTGLIKISIRNAGSGGIGDDDNLGGEDVGMVESPSKLAENNLRKPNNSTTQEGTRDIEVDISKLQVTKDVNTNSTLFESVVGTSIFVTHPKSSNGGTTGGESENEQGVDLPLVDTQDEDDMDTSSAVNNNDNAQQQQQEEGSVLHLRLVDQYGTILTLTFSYPSLNPTSSLSTSLNTSNNNTSFLLPLQKYTTNYQLNPHPGSIIENTNSICFPTNNSSVVFALNPHLYCVDFGANNGGESEGGKRGVKTRVWTNRHIVTSDPISDNNSTSTSASSVGGGSSKGMATPTPRKKKRTGLVSTITKATYSLMGISDYSNGEEYEYQDDEEQQGIVGTMSIPSIAALTNLTNDEDNDKTARVATLHSDGSLRIWTAGPSRKGKNNELRIPSVQRIAIADSSSNNSWTSTTTYINPPIPKPTKWDPNRDAITIRGKVTYDTTIEMYLYEVVLYVQCYSSTGRNNAVDGNVVYSFVGDVVQGSTSIDYDDMQSLPSGDTAKMSILNLPRGTLSVVDIAWSIEKHDLMVLLRHNLASESEDAIETFYDIGEEKDRGKAVLALYPTNEEGGGGYSEVVLPSNMTLPYLDLNHFGYVFTPSVDEELDRCMSIVSNSDDVDMDDDDNTSSSAAIAKAEAKVDRAGMLALLQPFGRCRPSTLAVQRALSSLDLLEYGDGGNDQEIRPVTVLSAMRKWKKRSAFQSTSSALVLVEKDDEDASSPLTTSDGQSIYHAFASSATKSSTKKRAPLFIEDPQVVSKSGGANAVEVARQAHRLKWIRLLSEIRRQEAHLDDALCLSSAPSSTTNLIVRGSMISALTIDDGLSITATTALPEQERDMMAGLDELSVYLMTFITSDPELRHLLSKVESMLYNGASKASSVVDGWHDKSYIELLSQVEQLGNSAMMKLELTDKQIGLLDELSQLHSQLIETWQRSPLSVSASVSTSLAISKPFDPMPNSDNDTTSDNSGDAISSAASLIAARLESIRLLSLSRLILVFGSPQKAPVAIQHGALRSTLYCTALSWAIHQSSSSDKSRTVLIQHLSEEVTKEFYHSGMTAALSLADMFVASAFSFYESSFHANEAPDEGLAKLTSPSHEPRVALRLLAPIVEYPAQSSSEINQKRREETAECLLEEAAMVAKLSCNVSVDAETSSPDLLWRLASKLLLDTSVTESPDIIWNLMNRVETLERHLTQIELSKTALPLCGTMILDAVKDAISSITSYLPPDTCVESTQIPALWGVAFQSAMFGQLWDEALHACISHPLADERKENLKLLILGMVNAGALDKLMDMSLAVVEDGGTAGSRGGLDLFALAAQTIEEAAVEQASLPVGSSSRDVESMLLNRPNYWESLYALHASRGNWRQAAHAMDMCGKATADFVSSSKASSDKPLVLSKALSRKIMDDACMSAQACVHAISLVEKPSQRYLLSGNQDIPSEARLLTQEDLERRAVRALALRTFSLDEYAPDSVSSILESTSRDTIDSLAKFGYYDQAIAVASGVSSKRKGLPGGVDLFDDALKYILITYLVPAAVKSPSNTDAANGVLESLQSRSKIAQIRTASSACALGSSGVQSTSSRSSLSGGSALQSTMAMDLLQQYTTVYSKRCHRLGINVADAILKEVSELPLWLRDLCMFDVSSSGSSKNGLFAQANDGQGKAAVADPTALMRLYIKHHQYGEACGVVTSILSTEQSSDSSTRLPEKGYIVNVPYDLIDMLWDMIESIISSNSSSTSSDDIKSQVKALTNKRNSMEKALEKHFDNIKTNEEGLKSARRLVNP